jgi:DNA-binding transcriptional ArsR family regulator
MSESRVAARAPSTDHVLESVAEETRRDVLAVLDAESGPVSVRELATTVAALRTGRSYAEVTFGDRMPIAVALVHVHLPALRDAGLLAWEPGGAVEPTSGLA